MSFSTALFYPWIDIKNTGWLNSAVLYWDSIRTIVPESVRHPYSSKTAQEFQEAGVLIPLRVHSTIDDIEQLADDVIKYLDTTEATEFFFSNNPYSHQGRIHGEKLPNTIRELSHIHPEKLPYKIRDIIENAGIFGGQEGDWYKVDSKFANYYMTLLATRLSDRVGAGLLTDAPISNKLAVTAKLDARVSPGMRRQREYEAYRAPRNMPSTLAQGMLVDLIIEKIRIDPTTPASKLLKFRQDNASALGQFRSEIDALTQSISTDLPAEHLQQAINDIYSNRVLPSISNLKDGLSSLGIKWFTDNYLKVAFLETSSTSMFALLGLSVPQALLVGTGISLTASAILYNLEKRQTLRDSPFAYVMAAERELGQKPG